jgi:POT family proton-dependent oligopeptide transporter
MATYAGSLLIVPVIIVMVANTRYTDYFMIVIGPASILYLFYEMKHFSAVENKKLLAALIFIIFSIFFWAFFESGGSLSFLRRTTSITRF